MKSINIKNPIPLSEYDPNIFFTMILIKKIKNGKLGSRKVKEDITFMLLDKFFKYFNCMKKNVVQWLFRINNFISKHKRKKQIQIKKEYVIFIGIINRLETEKTVNLKLTNLEKENKDKKEEKLS